MAEGRDVAPEALGECGERGGLGLERKPGEERTRLGGQTRPASGE